jgi:hypothetical protein
MAWAIGNPQQNAALQELIQQQSSDRVVAIVGAAICEDALKNALESRFRDTAGHSTDINEKLFRAGGPLGNFIPKIDLGYQLYAFEKAIRNAMYGIAEIRNLFAHQLDMNFESNDPRMVRAIAKLTLHEGRTHYSNPITETDHLETPIDPTNTARDKFLVNLKLCLLWLFGDHRRHGMWSNVPAVGTPPMQQREP